MSLAAFIAAQRARYGVPHAVACRALGVSQAWLYKWLHADVSLRRKRRAGGVPQAPWGVLPGHRDGFRLVSRVRGPAGG